MKEERARALVWEHDQAVTELAEYRHKWFWGRRSDLHSIYSRIEFAKTALMRALTANGDTR